jgi:hydrogenase nickel incorporation protein HypB
VTTTTVAVEGKILKENDRVAPDLRRRFEASGLLCLNFISAPGSGKTTLLEHTLKALPTGTRAAVLTGDIQTTTMRVASRAPGIR